MTPAKSWEQLLVLSAFQSVQLTAAGAGLCLHQQPLPSCNAVGLELAGGFEVLPMGDAVKCKALSLPE